MHLNIYPDTLEKKYALKKITSEALNVRARKKKENIF